MIAVAILTQYLHCVEYSYIYSNWYINAENYLMRKVSLIDREKLLYPPNRSSVTSFIIVLHSKNLSELILTTAVNYCMLNFVTEYFHSFIYIHTLFAIHI